MTVDYEYIPKLDGYYKVEESSPSKKTAKELVMGFITSLGLTIHPSCMIERIAAALDEAARTANVGDKIKLALVTISYHQVLKWTKDGRVAIEYHPAIPVAKEDEFVEVTHNDDNTVATARTYRTVPVQDAKKVPEQRKDEFAWAILVGILHSQGGRAKIKKSQYPPGPMGDAGRPSVTVSDRSGADELEVVLEEYP